MNSDESTVFNFHKTEKTGFWNRRQKVYLISFIASVVVLFTSIFYKIVPESKQFDNYKPTPLVKYNVDNIKEKTMWVFWNSGRANAPKTIAKTFDTFETVMSKLNWDFVVLSNDNILDYLYQTELCDNYFGDAMKRWPAHQSDCARTAILAKYGGLYLDASSFPASDEHVKILDQVWTKFTNESQFENYQVITPINVPMDQGNMWEISIWFIMAKRGSHFMNAWHQNVLQFVHSESNVFSAAFYKDEFTYWTRHGYNNPARREYVPSFPYGRSFSLPAHSTPNSDKFWQYLSLGWLMHYKTRDQYRETVDATNANVVYHIWSYCGWYNQIEGINDEAIKQQYSKDPLDIIDIDSFQKWCYLNPNDQIFNFTSNPQYGHISSKTPFLKVLQGGSSLTQQQITKFTNKM